MRTLATALFLALGLLLVHDGAAATRADPQCIGEARDARNACVADCLDTFREDKFLCRKVDPVCGNACRLGRATCMAPFLALLEDCVGICREELIAEKQECPPRGDPGRDACIDAAQVRAFVCRDTCREDVTVRAGLKACRQAARACIRACPPPPAVE